METSDITTVITRVCGEFDEMPGLRLTRWQAQKLWALDAGSCDRVLRVLVDRRFLTQITGGAYVRRDANSPRI